MRRWLFSAVLSGSLAVTACNYGPHVGENPRPFDSGLWKENKLSSGPVRCDMVEDLRDRVGLVGKTRQEIETLLGPPHTNTAELSDYDLCPSFMDVWILELHWKDERVVSANVRDT